MSTTDELLRERDSEEEQDEEPQRSRLRDRLSFPFSPRAFLAALVLMVLGAVAVGFVPLVPGGLAALVAVFVGAFTVGLVRGRRSYLEVAVAGTGVAVVAALTQFFPFLALSDFGLPLAGIGGGAGFLAALLGHYFGRDLRSGLTRDL